jgi:FkbM family methyltransferase
MISKLVYQIKKIYWSFQPPVEIRGGQTTATFESGPFAGNIEKLAASEQRMLEEVITSLGDNEVFYDVGAHIGLYSCLAANKTGKVVAFEPFPPNYRQLKINAEYNENIKIFDIALSDTQGKIPMTRSAKESRTGLGGVGIDLDSNSKGFEAQSMPADHIISKNNLPKPNVIKIDVEGASPIVIKGMEKSLQSSKCHTVFVEVHPPGYNPPNPSIEDFGMTIDELENHMRAFGFEMSEIAERGTEKQVKFSK